MSWKGRICARGYKPFIAISRINRISINHYGNKRVTTIKRLNNRKI